MGMTTERIIEIFNDYDRISGIVLRGNSEDDSLFNLETVEAMNSINVILHKYQKIEDIYYHQSGQALEDSLRSVIEDGKID